MACLLANLTVRAMIILLILAWVGRSWRSCLILLQRPTLQRWPSLLVWSWLRVLVSTLISATTSAMTASTFTSKATATIGGSVSSIYLKGSYCISGCWNNVIFQIEFSQTRSACNSSMEIGSVADRVRIDVWKGIYCAGRPFSVWGIKSSSLTGEPDMRG